MNARKGFGKAPAHSPYAKAILLSSFLTRWCAAPDERPLEIIEQHHRALRRLLSACDLHGDDRSYFVNAPINCLAYVRAGQRVTAFAEFRQLTRRLRSFEADWARHSVNTRPKLRRRR